MQIIREHRMDAVGSAVAQIAHDFNNILMAIDGHCELLLSNPEDTEVLRQELLNIKKSVELGAVLSRQLMAFEQSQNLRFKAINLNTILSYMEEVLRRIAGEKIEVMIDYDPRVGQIYTDAGQLEQVITQLVLNARDAMAQGGQLLLRTSNVELDEMYARHHANVTPGSYVMLFCSDTGIGMGESVSKRIFEPFFTTQKPAKGKGLGMFVVYSIVKKSGGHIWVYSEPGQGTTVRVYWPRLDTTRVAPIESLPRGDETILVVDDHQSVRAAVHAMLTAHGFTVLEASSAPEALQLANDYNGEMDLVITDVVMPQFLGPELVQRLLETHPKMKVLYMSGYSDEAVKHYGVVGENASFLEKPASMSVLLNKIREILG